MVVKTHRGTSMRLLLRGILRLRRLGYLIHQIAVISRQRRCVCNIWEGDIWLRCYCREGKIHLSSKCLSTTNVKALDQATAKSKCLSLEALYSKTVSQMKTSILINAWSWRLTKTRIFTRLSICRELGCAVLINSSWICKLELTRIKTQWLSSAKDLLTGSILENET